MKGVRDILGFPKSQRSPSYDENLVRYDLCKLGNFVKMHEIQFEANLTFGLMDLYFKV